MADDTPKVTMYLTRQDIFDAAVQGCQPISIAVERAYADQGIFASAVMVSYSMMHVYSTMFHRVAKLNVLPPLSTFNRAYWTGQIVSIEEPIYGELTDAERYPIS